MATTETGGYKISKLIKESGIYDLFMANGFTYEPDAKNNIVIFDKNNFSFLFDMKSFPNDTVYIQENLSYEYPKYPPCLKNEYTIDELGQLKNDLETKAIPLLNTLRPRMILSVSEVEPYLTPKLNELGFELFPEYTGEKKEVHIFRSKKYLIDLGLVTYIRKWEEYQDAVRFELTHYSDYRFRLFTLPEKEFVSQFYLHHNEINSQDLYDYQILDYCLNWLETTGLNTLYENRKKFRPRKDGKLFLLNIE